MARQLWLLRHAEAEPHGSRADSERRLTERGERQARAAGVALARIGVEFDVVLVSPKVRARQTAELAAQGWDPPRDETVRVYEPLAEGFAVEQAREVVAEVEADGRLLLVGHEPDLSRLVADLSGARIDMKKGGVAALRLDGSRGELLALLRPRELSVIAGLPV
jgi:phosphohistidine phosphatase